jgi:hypothetical protein
MTPAALRALVLARVADVQDLAEASGLAVTLAADLDAEELQAMLADLTAADRRLNAVLSHFAAEGGPGDNGQEDRPA